MISINLLPYHLDAHTIINLNIISLSRSHSSLCLDFESLSARIPYLRYHITWRYHYLVFLRPEPEERQLILH